MLNLRQEDKSAVDRLLILASISHQPSVATALCCTLHDFSSVRALDIVSTQPAPDPDPGAAHPPNNVCRCWQTLLGVVATNLPGADLNSSADPKGGGQDARNNVMQGTAFRRLGNCSCIALLPHIHVRIATKAGEKCRLGHQDV